MLIVDDEAINIKIVSNALRRKGYQCTSLSDGTEVTISAPLSLLPVHLSPRRSMSLSNLYLYLFRAPLSLTAPRIFRMRAEHVMRISNTLATR